MTLVDTPIPILYQLWYKIACGGKIYIEVTAVISKQMYPWMSRTLDINFFFFFTKNSVFGAFETPNKRGLTAFQTLHKPFSNALQTIRKLLTNPWKAFQTLTKGNLQKDSINLRICADELFVNMCWFAAIDHRLRG